MISMKGQPLGVQGLYGVGSALGTYGRYKAGRAQAKYYSDQAVAGRYQARQLDEVADFEYELAQKDKDRVLSELTDIYLSAGVELEGAPMETLARTAQQLALDNLVTRRNLRQQAHAARYQSQLLDKQAKEAKKAANIGLFGDIAGSIVPFFL